jgi:hypothetical protein
MALNARQAFKAGFIARCIEDGVPTDQIAQRAKQAMDKMAVVGEALNMVRSLGSHLLSTGVPLALAVPPAIGAIGGVALSKATDIDDTEIRDIKDQEVINEYKRQSAKLRRQKAIRDYQAARKTTGRVFG